MKTKKLLTVFTLLVAVLIAGCKKDDYQETVGVCPIVISTNPTSSATGVSLNQIIEVTFNQKMNPLTINSGAFTLVNPAVSKDEALKTTATVEGTVTYNAANNTMYFEPSENLLPNTTYKGTVFTTVKDLLGNALQQTYVWSFTTGVIVSPTVILTSPLSDATGVALNSVITAKFSVPMNPLTITAANFMVKNGLLAVPGIVSYDELTNTATFTPSTPLLSNTVYTSTITTGAKNTLGNPLLGNYTWNFTTINTTPPAVILTDPLNTATGIAMNKTITATFNIPLDATTVSNTTFLVKNNLNVPVAGAVTYTGTTASFNPTNPLDMNTVYTATITTGVKSKDGFAMVANHVWSFTTSNFIAPTVILTDPLDNATGVALNKTITATFSVSMDPLTITGTTFTVKNGNNAVAGTVSYNGVIATFNPTANLLSNTKYTVTITTGAKNTNGIALANNKVWDFTTINTTAPIVILTDPLDGATGVALNKTITATFSVPMDPLTITGITFTVKNGNNSVAGTVSYNGVIATFNPTANLSSNTVYTVTITTGAKNTNGFALDNNKVWSFTTLNNTPPTVILTDPLDNATGVALNKTITATFSVPMDPLTITGTTFTVKNGNNAVAGTVSYNGTTATFNPNSNLLSNTNYTVTITTGAKNTNGIALANDKVWDFTTLNNLPPTVILTDPLDNATGVALNKTITATFSVPMDPLTITGTTFTVKNGNNAVAGAVSYNGTTATFNPNSNLLSNTKYTVIITTDAKNTNGIALVNDKVWDFTTLNEVIPIPAPNLGKAAAFGAFGGNAGITNQGLNTVINNGSIATTAAATLVTGFHDSNAVYTETPLNVGNVTGSIFTAPPAPGTATSFQVASEGLLDANAAYLSISPASKPGGIDPGAGELGGLTLAPGIYKSASGTFKISNGDLTLDAKGDPNAVWIFQTAAGLTVGIAGPAGARSVKLIGGAAAKNVFWYVGSAAVINDAGGGVMTGNIIATSGVTFSTAGNVTQTVLNGRAISLVASVTMVNTTINVPNQ